MLDDSTRAEIKDRILDEIAEAEERVMALEKATETVAPDKAIGRLSRLEALSDKGVNEAALSQTRQRLAQLEMALTRVFLKDFGICAKCRKTIPLERLLAMPQATQCVSCAASG